MSIQFETLQQPALYPEAFDVAAPEAPLGRKMSPRKLGVFICKAVAPVDANPGATTQAESVAETPAPTRVLLTGQWGMVPPWVKSASDAKLRSTKLVNARSETVSTSNNFRDAWLTGQRCIVPMMAFFEDDWRSGKAVPTRIARVDGKPMGVAALWQRWTGKAGKGGEGAGVDEVIISYTLLTVNANSHALIHRYQQPGAEKRMLSILNEGAYDAWLGAPVEKAREFMRAYPANWLTANPVEK